MPPHRQSWRQSRSSSEAISLLLEGKPVLWFAQVEAVFTIARITGDETRFRYNHQSRSNYLAVCFWHHNFTTDSKTLRDTQNASHRLVWKLLRQSSDACYGDKNSPRSHRIWWQQLRNLAGGQCTDLILGTTFMEHLLENVRTIIAISETTDLAKLAI